MTILREKNFGSRLQDVRCHIVVLLVDQYEPMAQLLRQVAVSQAR